MRKRLVCLLLTSILFFMIPTENVSEEPGAAAFVKYAVFDGEFSRSSSDICNRIVKYMQKKGRNVEVLKPDAIVDPEVFNADSFSVLILPESQEFPVNIQENMVTFLENGGDLISLNGPPFSNPWWKLDSGEYIDRRTLIEIRNRETPEKILYNFNGITQEEIDNYIKSTRDTNDYSVPLTAGIIREESGAAGNCLQVNITNYRSWDTFALKFREKASPDLGLLCFRARGARQTTMLCVELTEKDGSRWIASLKIKPEWGYFVLPPSDFKYWKNSRTKGSRGYKGDAYNIEDVESVRFGLAMSHTFIPIGDHTFWIDEIGLVSSSEEKLISEFNPPIIENVSPEYKYYPLKDPAETQVCLPGDRSDIRMKSGYLEDAFSPVWKPQGTGIHKNRASRFIPLIKAYDGRGTWSGTLAASLLNLEGTYKNSLCTSITFSTRKFYRSSDFLKLLDGIIDFVEQGLYFTEAGTEYFAYFHDDKSVRLGAEIVNMNGKEENVRVGLEIERRSDGRTVYEVERNLVIPAGEKAGFEETWKIDAFAAEEYVVSAHLYKGLKILDRISHELNIWRPAETKDFITVKEAHFYSPEEKKVWVPYGVNFMPSTGIAFEDRQSFEHWLDPHTYDPEMIEADLSRVSDVLNLNMVSVFLYSGREYSGNLLDLLYRCRKHNLKVNMSLRPFADPMNFRLESPTEIISRYRLDENDTVFAYDIAWEPWLGPYEKRRKWDRDWAKWIISQYGSVQKAESDWGVKVPLDAESNVTGPSDDQLMTDGDWRVMIAAYRRFVDDLIGKKYTYAIRKIKELDPNHLVSFRMSEGGNPTCLQGEYPYDMRSIAKAVDFFTPEGYGRFNFIWDGTKSGIYTAWYARSLVNKPVFWGEFGMNIWTGSNFNQNVLLDVEKDGYENFYRMIYESRSDGCTAWWYPGGFRVDENSDFGMLNPDGSVRPLIEPVLKYKPLITEAQVREDRFNYKPDYWITLDRDKHVDGIFGVYNEVKDEFWEAYEKGHVVGFKTEGTGTTSVNTPLTAVGNVEYNGDCPLKYLNGQFNYVRIKNKSGEWIEVKNNGIYKIEKGSKVIADISIGNTGEAKWISPSAAPGGSPNTGNVYLSISGNAGNVMKFPLARDVPHYEDIEMNKLEIDDEVDEPVTISFRLTAKDRADFGEKFSLTLKPE